jgi:hypothetical protein
MSQYQVNESKVGTGFGIFFFFVYVIPAYRINKWFLRGDVLTGGRFFWRMVGWELLCCIPLFGWIYGYLHISDIVDTRNFMASRRDRVMAIYQEYEHPYQPQPPMPMQMPQMPMQQPPQQPAQ